MVKLNDKATCRLKIALSEFCLTKRIRQTSPKIGPQTGFKAGDLGFPAFDHF